MTIPFKKITITAKSLQSTSVLKVWIDGRELPDISLTENLISDAIVWYEKCTFQGPRYVKIQACQGPVSIGGSTQTIMTEDGEFKQDCVIHGDNKNNPMINRRPIVKNAKDIEGGLMGEWHYELSPNDIFEFDYVISH